MIRYFLHLAYNGKAYHGWQIQPGDVTVQETLEKCISLKLKQDISVTGCGRTDTGVNARNFYAHFESEPIEDLQGFVNQALEGFLGTPARNRTGTNGTGIRYSIL